MKTYLRTTILIAFVAAAISMLAADQPAVPRWQPHDFSFTAKAQPPNPFMVEFSATVKGPDGKTFSLPGFFDGNGTWKVRVAPTKEGEWSLITKSELPELNDRKAAFTCVKEPNPKIHGVLRVDKEHPHHFIFDDSTRFFMQGYEYDWLWALDMDRPGLPTVGKSLDILTHYGFNYVLLNSYAHDTDWHKGNTGQDDYGPPLLYAWQGSNERPDHSRMNLAYWRHYDQVMTVLMDRGIEAHMFIKVYNKYVNWPVHGSENEKMFFRWLVARYAAYPNIIWDFSKEAHREKNLAYKQNCLKYFREIDPYHHLMTVHDDDKANDSGAYDDLTDFRADQEHGTFRETILRQRARRAWPVANVESDYECGLGGMMDKTYDQAETADQTALALWQIAMGGGYTAYYYTYTAWDVIHPFDVPPGYALMKHFGDFWRGTKYWLLQPADNLASAGWCLADEGREYVVYFNTASPFTIKIEGVVGKLTAQWFNPLTGLTTDAGSCGIGSARFAPPADWGNAPLVLHLREK